MVVDTIGSCNMEQDTFYNIDFDDREQLLRYALELSDSWHVDILDCYKSFCRQRIEMSWEEIMSKLDPSVHFVVIHRRSPIEGNFGEVGFSTMESPAYFLWVFMTIDNFKLLVEKFNLKPC